MSEYGHFRVYLDPLGRVLLPDGSYRHQIELVLSDDPDRDPPSLADPVLRLDAQAARQLAQQLLTLAWHAQPAWRSEVPR
jgi:hypothetical protein